MSTINLIPPLYTSQRAVRRRQEIWGATCTIIGTLSALTISLSIANTPPTIDGEARLARLQTEQHDYWQRAGTLMGELETAMADVELLEQVSRQPDWSPLLSDLARWSAGEAQLELVEIRLGPSDISFQAHFIGISSNQEFVGSFVGKMRESKWFNKVTLVGTQRVRQSSPPTFRFEISCEIAGFIPQAEALR